MVTGSFDCGPYREKIFPKERHDMQVVKFFKRLGYGVERDFNRRDREEWHEILDEEGMVCQIDRGIPLQDIIDDCAQLHLGLPGVSKSDYKISGPHTKRFAQMLKKIYEVKMYGYFDNEQMELL